MCYMVATDPRKYQYPCGKCPECREKIRKFWTFRALAESLCHSDNYFVTLTYDNEHEGIPGDFDKVGFQKFLKRLRKRISFRYVAVSEYGSHTARKHYHILLFMEKGLENVPQGVQYEDYFHEFIRKTWNNGNVCVTPFTPKCASYVMKYHLKNSPLPYDGADKPFLLASRRPSIGLTYLLRNAEYLKAQGIFRFKLFERSYYISSYFVDKVLGSELRTRIRERKFYHQSQVDFEKDFTPYIVRGFDITDTPTLERIMDEISLRHRQNTIAYNEMLLKKQLKLSDNSL